ncbi:hypothetical protein [Streptomyces sp. NPDC050485]|uniref:hypothetical protein n=1 Tax=Streptomyces sp. NPDC050485 TaxID=3365617 RepID=UPI0037BAC4E5
MSFARRSAKTLAAVFLASCAFQATTGTPTTGHTTTVAAPQTTGWQATAPAVQETTGWQ